MRAVRAIVNRDKYASFFNAAASRESAMGFINCNWPIRVLMSRMAEPRHGEITARESGGFIAIIKGEHALAQLHSRSYSRDTRDTNDTLIKIRRS